MTGEVAIFGAFVEQDGELVQLVKVIGDQQIPVILQSMPIITSTTEVPKIIT